MVKGIPEAGKLSTPGAVWKKIAVSLGFGARSRRRHRIPVRLQKQTWDCGAACLSMALASHGIEVSVDRLQEETDLGRDGTSARVLLETGRKFGLQGRGVRVSLDGLHRLHPGSILYWNSSHYVVLERVAHGRVFIIDPSSGRRVLDIETVADAFGGIAIEFHSVPGPAGSV
ncbi:cysteine peptidase family C39 domain-containing protein [Streptomyces sp. NPDC014734]|uniref:cysteine peptidase family C39 domain-containing protein n=1 Tax=Streptomyces sp. NPDC014734 TaxID=3364886 RepID=UPI0036FE7A68